SLRAEDTAVY
nr:immunoglobulin heavy chain junction region [Homo sapiens]MBN4641896.1 immunoglobulin heavy chain junction region [Homo sapiens]